MALGGANLFAWAGAGLLGLSLSDVLRMQSARADDGDDANKLKSGWGKAKSVIMIFLQGGPSHLDIWDPKPDAPEAIRGEFKAINTNVPGIQLSEVMPQLAKQMDKATLIRSLSYTPAGLFNHTAAIYQMMTGYTPDKVSPSGQLEPPARNDYPCAGSQIARIKTGRRIDAAVRDAAARATREQRDWQGRHGGIFGRVVGPVLLLQRSERLVHDGGFGAPETTCRKRAWNAARHC